MAGDGDRGKPRTTREDWDGPTAGIQASKALRPAKPVTARPARPAETVEDWDGPTSGIQASTALQAARGASPARAPAAATPPDDWDGPTAGIQAADALRGASPRFSAARPVARAAHAPHGDADLEPGTTISGYKVTQQVGGGPMGKVYAAVQPTSGRRVAIRVIPPGLTRSSDVTERFVAEVRLINRIGHPNVVDVFSFGRLPDRRLCLVMPFLEGESLATALERTTVVRLDDGVTIALLLCDALAAAHAQGVVHRRLRPTNVFVGSGHPPTVKLLDFGLAALQDRPDATPPGVPDYLAPEQCRGGGVDRRTDIYALGIMMYEMFAGTTPFAGDSVEAVLTAHVSREPPPPSSYTHVPPPLEQIILRAIRKKPEQRFGTVGELAKALKLMRAELPPAPPTIRLYRG